MNIDMKMNSLLEFATNLLFDQKRDTSGEGAFWLSSLPTVIDKDLILRSLTFHLIISVHLLKRSTFKNVPCNLRIHPSCERLLITVDTKRKLCTKLYIHSLQLIKIAKQTINAFDLPFKM